MSRTATPTLRNPSPAGAPLQKVKIFIWDTGTTGTSPSNHAITALAAIEHTPTSGSPAHFSTLVKPWDSTLRSSSASVKIPRLPQAFQQLAEFISDNTPQDHTPLLVAHNAPFDAAFLLKELNRAGLDTPDWLFADSLQLFRNVFPDNATSACPYSLENLANRFGVPVRRSHHAGDDVLVLRHCLEFADDRLSDRGDQTLQCALYANAESLHRVAERYVDHPILAESDTLLPYITTRTGKFFHMDEACRNLRSAKRLIRVETPNPGLRRCYLCCDNEKIILGANVKKDATVGAHEYSSSSETTDGRLSGFSEHTDDHPVTEENSRSVSCLETSAAVGTASTGANTYITTRTGHFYHKDKDCKYLRRAKALISLTKVPTHLRACPLCCVYGKDTTNTDDEQRARSLNPVVATSRLGSSWSVSKKPEPVHLESPKVYSNPVRHGDSIPNMQKRTYITTRTGKYFHMDRDCRNLRSAKQLIPVNDRPQHLSACYLCCSNADLQDKEEDTIPYVEEEFEDFSIPSAAPTTVDLNKRAVPEPRYQDSVSVTSYDESSPYTKTSSLERHGTHFVKTSTGKKFHLESCRTVRNKKVSQCKPAEENKDPCRVCLLELFQEWEMSGFTQ